MRANKEMGIVDNKMVLREDMRRLAIAVGIQ
jgi:hypothetical protein